jgi:hypothetical protein
MFENAQSLRPDQYLTMRMVCKELVISPATFYRLLYPSLAADMSTLCSATGRRRYRWDMVLQVFNAIGETRGHGPGRRGQPD